ncbi:MAG: cation transporter dimerization domain-containing protein, partial [Tissierellaceae bacterium]
GIKSIRSRIFNERMYVDLEIFVDPDISVREGHDIAKALQYRIESEFKSIKHTMVHIVPNNK